MQMNNNLNPQKFTKYDDNIKVWRRHLSLSQWGILAIIHEKIERARYWNKESDAVSISQIMAECTLSKSAIKKLLAGMRSESGPLEVVSYGILGIPTYRVRIWPPTASTGSESDPIAPLTGSESGPTTDTPYRSINRTEADGGAEAVAVPANPAEFTGNQYNTESSRQQHLLQKEGLVVEDELPDQPTHTSQNQLSNQRSSVSVLDNKGLGLDAQPLRKKQNHSVVSKRTNMRYEMGVDDIGYMSDVLEISLKDARGIMHDCPGATGYQVLCVVLDNEKSKKRVMNANNRPAYVHTIVKANLTKILSQDRFPGERKATKQTPPRTRAPLPLKAPAVSQESADRAVLNAIHALGNGRYTFEEIDAEFGKTHWGYTKEDLRAHLPSMARCGLLDLSEHGDGFYRYKSLEVAA
jgi:hypothetical protein